MFIIAAMLSVVTGEDCGYVRGPLATTNDTVVINLDCKQSTSSSHNVPLQLPDNVTHVAAQLLHCSTVPVGLFTIVTENLTSLTVSSEDAIHLLEGTFEGLGHLTELRLIGFSSLKNLSVSLFEPLRNIETLILDGFGRSNIKLFHLGSAIRKLTNTPIKRLVLNDIRADTSSRVLEDRTVRADDFKISNASVKELIISNTRIIYKGSIRRAFPHLTCFYGSADNVLTEESFPVMWDLVLLSNTLKKFTKQQYGLNPGQLNVTVEQLFRVLLRTLKHYPDLQAFLLNAPTAKDCAIGIKFTFGANISRITLHGTIRFIEKIQKPICVEQNNMLEYLDCTGTPYPSHFTGVHGLKKLKYLNLANTGIKSVSNDFLQYFPALEILKLSQLDIGEFIKSIDGNFFAFNPALAEIHLDNCQLKDISSNLISGLLNKQRFRVINEPKFSHKIKSDFRNRANIKLLNFSRNNIRTISQNSIDQLNKLALGKPEESELNVDLSYNDLHCLCNSTYFVEWLQRSGLPANSKIKFPGFNSYTCLYPNGSIVRVSAVIIGELEQQCGVIQTLVNGSDCPCDDDLRRRLQQIRVYLDGYFCRNDAGKFVPMKSSPLPSCYNPYSRAYFIAPVVIGGLLGITVLITVGLLIYYRNSRRVKQVRECLEMNPVRFVHTALQYVTMNNRAEESEPSMFRYDMFVFVQDDDQSSIHTHFSEALQGERSVITRDNIGLGTVELDKTLEYISVCQWFVPVLTSNFLTDPVCKIFMSKIQFNRFSAVIPVVWELSLDVRDDASIKYLLQTGEPLYWPGDLAAAEERRNFWSSLLERTIPPQ